MRQKRCISKSGVWTYHIEVLDLSGSSIDHWIYSGEARNILADGDGVDVNGRKDVSAGGFVLFVSSAILIVFLP